MTYHHTSFDVTLTVCGVGTLSDLGYANTVHGSIKHSPPVAKNSLTWVLAKMSSLSAAISSIMIAKWPSRCASFPRLFPLLFLLIFEHLASSAEIYKKDLEEISKNTWQNIVTILKKGLKKDQTPDQAYAELIATGLSKEVLQVRSNFRHSVLVISPFFSLNQNIKAGTAGLDFVEKVESWFSTVVGKPAEGTGSEFPT